MTTPAHTPMITDAVRRWVLDRDASTCRRCGIPAGHPHPTPPHQTATLDVIAAVAPAPDGPPHAHLITVCSRCRHQPPLPNTVITTPAGSLATVVASAVLDDDTTPATYTVLLLNPIAPHYTVAQLDPTGTLRNPEDFPNIVPATAAYTHRDGDH